MSPGVSFNKKFSSRTPLDRHKAEDWDWCSAQDLEAGIICLAGESFSWQPSGEG